MSLQTTLMHNLPPQSTAFVGRQSEISDIASRFQDRNCRLLTLVGSGGIGKTRLAIESISYLIGSDFEHGVFYVPLAPLTSAENIVTTIINVLGIVINEEGSAKDELLKFLSLRNLLLVMDNFEHVLEGADIVADILNNTDRVKILVTSREVLNLSMEHVWHVRGMRYPDNEEPEDINQYDALNLFVERAMQVRRDFSLSAEQVSIIQICQRVEGLPLAIELAAGWLKTLSCTGILKQIEQSINFLATRNRDIPERHRSIHAIFNHSWDLLSDEEQAVFPRLAVFRGGFTLEAAEQATEANLLILSGLVEKSMIRHDVSGRYDVHELLRQHGENLLRRIDEFEAINKTHMNYFARYTAERTEDLKGERQIDVHKELMGDYSNVLRAWDYAVKCSDYDEVGAMLEALNVNNFLSSVGYSMLQWLDSAHLKMQNPISREHRIVANRLLAWKMYWIGFKKYEHFLYGGVESMSNMSFLEQVDDCLHEAKDNHDLIAQMLYHVAKALLEPSVDHLADDHLISLALSRRVQDRWYECICLSPIIQHYYFTKRVRDSDGDAYLEQYLENALATRNPYHMCVAHTYRSIAALDRGDVLESIKSKKNAIEYWQRVGNKSQIAGNHIHLSTCYLSLGDFSQARKHIGISIQTYKEIQENITYGFMLLAKMEVVEGKPQDAIRHLQEINYEERGGVFQYECLSLYQLEIGNIVDARQSILRVLSEGLVYVGTRPMIDLIPHVSFVMAHDSNYEVAVELLGLTDSCKGGATDWMEKWNKLTQLRADLKTELGEEAYQQAWERGSQRDLEDTIAELCAYLSDDQSPSKAKSQALIDPLTSRELDVLELLGEGLSNRKIADQLTVSVGTVKTHVYNICQKFNVNNRTQAVLEAKKLGLL
jgi:predicted ATPase/DNA-binding CsgD family transcriptional regulator